MRADHAAEDAGCASGNTGSARLRRADARTCHPHPTLSEAIKEAALAVDKRAISM
jgi:hypothetical protein